MHLIVVWQVWICWELAR